MTDCFGKLTEFSRLKSSKRTVSGSGASTQYAVGGFLSMSLWCEELKTGKKNNYLFPK